MLLYKNWGTETIAVWAERVGVAAGLIVRAGAIAGLTARAGVAVDRT